jgi:hypothetical protein
MVFFFGTVGFGKELAFSSLGCGDGARLTLIFGDE